MATSMERSPTAKESEIWNEHHGDAMLNGLYAAWKEGKYCDIKIVVGTDHILTHKVLLVSLSEYFKALLNMDTKEGQDRIELHHINFSMLYLLLQYGYTGKINITGENVQEIAIAADYLQVTFVKEACESFMMQNITVTNCIDLLQFSHMFHLRQILDKAHLVIGTNISDISETEEFTLLSPEDFEEILKREDILMFQNEYVLQEKSQELAYLRAVLRYMSRRNDIKANARQLLFSVRLPHIDDDILMQELQKEKDKLAENNIDITEVLDLVETAKKNKENIETNVPLSWKLSRHRNLRSISQHHGRYASGGQVHPTIATFEYIHHSHDPDNRLVAITIINREWDGWVVVGGIVAKYSDGTQFSYGLERNSEHCIEQNTLELEEDEVITDVTVRYGWMINCLTFHTSSERVVGPFGGDVGGNVTKASGDERILLGFKGSIVDDQGCKAVLNLTFIWMSYDGRKEDQSSHSDSDSDSSDLSCYWGDMNWNSDNDIL